MREQVLALKRESEVHSTALVAHGANPGFVSVLVKIALLDMAKLVWPERAGTIHPVERADWARLAADLDVRVIQISERDTQRTSDPHRPRVLMNTWSVDGFIAECRQEAELGCTHGSQSTKTES
ncbi:Homospermidine synthase [Candidatus Burkholderia verschuerenii]|uniref:Homospermidine synthase n=1 Tax=Candidatus Burkholderia verschuerenii TaxID=242163 RepID=A0A0L0M3A3_9BURK|nr:Homospermidine synthase [Candidatus Burkholderia verschuerenii]